MYRALVACSTCKRSCSGDPATDTIQVTQCEVNASALSASGHPSDALWSLWNDSWKAEDKKAAPSSRAPREADVQRCLTEDITRRRVRTAGPTLLTREADVKCGAGEAGTSKDQHAFSTHGGGHPLRRSAHVQESNVQEHAGERNTEMDEATADPCREEEVNPQALEFGPPIGRTKNTQQLAEEAQEHAEATEELRASAALPAGGRGDDGEHESEEEDGLDAAYSAAAAAAETAGPTTIEFSASGMEFGLSAPLTPVVEEVLGDMDDDEEEAGEEELEETEASEVFSFAREAEARGAYGCTIGAGAGAVPQMAGRGSRASVADIAAAAAGEPHQTRPTLPVSHGDHVAAVGPVLRKRDRLGGLLWRRAWVRLQAVNAFSKGAETREFKLGGA